jgi:hypothetical protein
MKTIYGSAAELPELKEPDPAMAKAAMMIQKKA